MNGVVLTRVIFNRYKEYLRLENKRNNLVNKLRIKYGLDLSATLRDFFKEAKKRGDLETMGDIIDLDEPKRIALFESVSDLASMFCSLCGEGLEDVYEYLSLDPLPDDEEDTEEYHADVCDCFQEAYRDIDIDKEIKIFTFSGVSIMVIYNIIIPIVLEEGAKVTTDMLRVIGVTLGRPDIYLVGMRYFFDFDPNEIDWEDIEYDDDDDDDGDDDDWEDEDDGWI